MTLFVNRVVAGNMLMEVGHETRMALSICDTQLTRLMEEPIGEIK